MAAALAIPVVRAETAAMRRSTVARTDRLIFGSRARLCENTKLMKSARAPTSQIALHWIYSTKVTIEAPQTASHSEFSHSLDPKRTSALAETGHS
jgi:hypothetical protein